MKRGNDFSQRIGENEAMDKIITIDGPSGAGKSSISRLVAKKLKYLYLDTGAMYRAVALQAKREGISMDDADGLKRVCRELDLNFRTEGEITMLYNGDEDISMTIRTPEMDMLASTVSARKEVRESLTELQQKIGRKGEIVAEGRDMGTVVFPKAKHKFFLTAAPEKRAERRYDERVARGESISRALVDSELKKRDEQDTKRALAPLHPAEDAIIVDSTELNLDEVVEKILVHIERDK